MMIVRTIEDMTALRDSYFKGKVGLVPTMGALHAGHLSLVEKMKKKADLVILSIFVNPLQFSPGEDYEKYPRFEEEDCAKCKEVGVDVVYIPTVSDMYPEGFSVEVGVGPLAYELCGSSRKCYMGGIMVVLLKLVMQTKADFLILGEKDYQMLFLARKLFRDIDASIEVLQGDTFRDAYGLALSSRHTYLSAEEKVQARFLHDLLSEMASGLTEHPESVGELVEQGKQLLHQRGFRVDYLEVRSNATMEKIESCVGQVRIFLACYLGDCRLIDNVLVH